MRVKTVVLLVGVLALCIGCDDLTEVSRVSNHDPHQETRREGCSYFGWGFGYDGKYGVHFCPGHQEALVSVDHDQVTFKSGRKETVETEQIIKYTTECSQ